MNPIESKQEYQKYVEEKSPNSPIFKNCFNAFWVGGLICTIGQIILNICKERGFDTATSGTIVSILLIAIVLLQSGKAVSPDSNIMGGNDELFANRKERGGELFITRLTAILGVAFFVICIVMNFI